MGLVLTADAFNLYVMLEITSITTYGLIAMGRGRAPLSSFNYIIMGSVAACFYLLGVGYLYLLTGTLNMADIATLPAGPAGKCCFSDCSGFHPGRFVDQDGLFPPARLVAESLHRCPRRRRGTHRAADDQGHHLSDGPPDAHISIAGHSHLISMDVRTLVIWAAAIGIVCASSLALAQRNLKQMLTYIIIAEVGYMVGGAWLANEQGMTGALLHIVNDALMTLCLFLAAVAIAYRTGSLHFDSLKGLYQRMPWTMAAFTVGAFAMIGIPPTCGFFSKWYLLLGGIEAGQWQFVIALIFSSLVNAVLFFRIIELAYFGSLQDGEHHEHAIIETARSSMVDTQPSGSDCCASDCGRLKHRTLG